MSSKKANSYLHNIRNSYCFDDVLLLPRYSDISSRKNINLETELSSNTELRSLKLKSPLISSPMDTVTDDNMAIHMALNGGIGIIHRFMSNEMQLEKVKNVKRYVQYVFTNPYSINENARVFELKNELERINIKTLCVVNDDNELMGIITKRDCKNLNELCEDYSHTPIAKLMTPKHNIRYLYIDSENELNDKLEYYLNLAKAKMIEHRIEKIPVIIKKKRTSYLDRTEKYVLYGIITDRSIKYYFENKKMATLDKLGRLCCGVAIGVHNIDWQHIENLVNNGVDLLCIDVANGYNKNCIDTAIKLRSKYPHIIIMAGNICTDEGLKPFADADVDCIRIGIGNGSICTTRLQTGVGFGQFTAINEIMDEKINNNYSIKLISDGGSLGKIGNKVKALASGADAIMLGRSLAGCLESPGMIINKDGKKVKYFRGMASKMASLSKNNDNINNVNITSEGIDGTIDVKGSVADIINEINGGICSGLSYLGCHNLKELNLLRIQNEIEWGLSTSIGLNETGTRIKKN